MRIRFEHIRLGNREIRLKYTFECGTVDEWQIFTIKLVEYCDTISTILCTTIVNSEEDSLSTDYKNWVCNGIPLNASWTLT